MATMMGRPSIHDMIQAAVAGTAEKISANLAAEASYQAKLAEEGCDEDEKKKDEKKKLDHGEKTASARIKLLADALDYASMCVKEGSISIDAGTTSGVGPGVGPNALTVMESPSPAPYNQSTGQAIGKDIPPKNPPMQKGLTGPHGGGASLMANDHEHAPGGSQHQKVAAPVTLILQEFAKIKQAEDALNPAQISAGRTVPPDTRESGQAGPPSPQGSSMVASAESVTSLTRGQAKAAPKAEMKTYVDQPALSAAHDPVLQHAFAHTSQAGPKIASASDTAVKVAAARAYLEQLVDEVKVAPKGGR